jgi:cytochrome-b5 reductase
VHQFDEFTSKYPENFFVYYMLAKPPKNWNNGTGFVTKELVEGKFPKPSKESKALLCNFPGLVNATKKNLEELGGISP